MKNPSSSVPDHQWLVSTIRQGSPQWMARLALLRLRAHWRSLSTAILGIVLVAVIGASVPLYTAAIAQVGMIQRLHQQPVQDVSLYLQTSQSAAQVDSLEASWAARDAELRRLMGQTFRGDLSGWAGPLVAAGETTPMQVVVEGQDRAARLRIVYYEGWQDRLRLVEGRWPSAQPGPGIPLEGAIGTQAAERLGLGIGDALVLEQRGWDSSVPLPVVITAIVREASDLHIPADVQAGLRISSQDAFLDANLFTTRQGFLWAAIQHVPDSASTFGWWSSFDHEALSFADVSQATAAVDSLQQALPADSRVTVRSRITTVLRDYTDEVDLLGAPFGLLLIQIGALALFFLIVTAALVRRAERREIAMLQSRGGANWQIALLDTVEMLLIGALAAAVAPFVARQVLVGIIPTLTGIERLPLALNGRVFAYAAIAAGVSVLVLALSLIPFLRLPLITGGGAASRSEKRLWWQRSYLDIVLLVVGIAASWRLVSQGTPLIRTQASGLKADPLLLLAPIVLAVAVGSLVLRLFPLLSGWAARAVARWGRLEGALAMWQVSRESAHYGRLSFLLALAIGVGWLATSFHATLDRSQRDQAAYRVGSDIRLQERDVLLQSDRARSPSFYQGLPGVEAAALTARFFVPNASQDPQQPMPGEVLAVDARTFGQAAYWPGDLGERQSPPATADLRDPGRALPFLPARIGLWLRLDQPAWDPMAGPALTETGEIAYEPNLLQLRDMLDVTLRLRDATGLRLDLPLEPQDIPAGPEGWLYFEGDLSPLSFTLQGQIWLDGVLWRSTRPFGFTQGRLFRLFVANLTLIDSGQGATTLAWMQPGSRWEFVESTGEPLNGKVVFTSAPGWDDTIPALQLEWDQQPTITSAALVLDYPDLGPIPALASSRTAALNGLLPGTEFQVGMIARTNPWFELVETIAYYPTLYPDTKLFLVVDLPSLLYALNRQPGPIVNPSEVWLRLRPGASPEAVLAALNDEFGQSTVVGAQTMEQVLRDFDADMLQSGLIGLLYLAFAVAMILSVISLVSYMALSVRQRQSNFGVLQAIGLSVRRLVTSLLLEQIIVMAVGIMLGVLLGAVMSDRVLPALAFSTSGETITPPFAIRIEAVALMRYGAFLLGVLALTFALSLLLVLRLSLAELLRFGEE